ncbi:IS110 family transposase [Plantactinospora sp. CA-294935]|uniref:IS110 family transposase n=1 Tax=Plantactinospora sp. CA-294935 TaxID=3240012 RepID=UPI003D8BB46E
MITSDRPDQTPAIQPLYIGMDVHREFAQLAVVEDGLVRDEGRIGVTPEALRQWAAGLRDDDQVALEATGNSDAIATLLTPLVGRVVVSNPSKTRAIAEAKVKTDKVDARILAQLLAADFLPPVWLPDERIRSLRRQVTRRAHLVRQRTRIKNQVHAILARNLAPTPPVSDLFGKTGRHWLSRQPLPADESSSVCALLRQLDFHGEELAVVDKELAIEAFADPVVARLMTIPGIDAIAAISIVAAVGDFTRFDDADKLVAYVGLNPKVRQSGNSAPVHGRISKAGRAHVRGVLVEAAWSASRAPGPLRAFFQRIKARRGFPTAVVATARKMTALAWHLVTKDQDYAFARPGLVAHKRRKLELATGAPSRRGNHRTPGAAYNDKQRRAAETAAAEQAEHAYEILVAHWQPHNPAKARAKT